MAGLSGATVPAEVSRSAVSTETSPLQPAPAPTQPAPAGRAQRVKLALYHTSGKVWTFGKAVRVAVPLLIIFLLLSTVAFMALEKFSGRDAFYFCMVLLT